jgi:protein TonB
MTVDLAERAIEGAAALLTAGLVAGLLLGDIGLVKPDKLPAAPPMQIALTLAAAPAPPAPTAPAPAPQPAMAAKPPEAPASSVAAILPAPRKLRRLPRKPNAMITPAAVMVPQRSAEPAPSPAVPAAPPAADPTENALYTGRIRAAIERNKWMPASPAYRMMRPHGTATVAFTLTRTGQSDGVRVIGSSGSALLDNQAAAIVASCAYPPMPPAAFRGEASHLFQVEVTFPPFGGEE